jgi:adenylate kinase family enzyme
MTQRIHITGASGSGTTTLGLALAGKYDCSHVDTDDYFWLPTDPPFQQERPVDERRTLLEAQLSQNSSWILSGSLCGWGDIFIPLFSLVVFLYVPLDIRLARLLEREQSRYGSDAIAPGGIMHTQHSAFIAWATAYDDGDMQMRSKQRHEQWLKTLPCPVLRIEGAQKIETLVACVNRSIASTT